VLGLVVGITLGLVITWGVLPVTFTNADPADLRQSLKDDYVRLASVAYETNANLETARRRIESLQLSNPTQTFDNLIALEQNSKSTDTQDALIHLGQALGLKLPYTAQRPAPGAPTPETVYVVATPIPSILTFRLVEHSQLTCTDEPDTAHLRITVRDSAGHDMPNIGIEVRSTDINETIYTGLKPERGVGYADYETTPGTYAVRILDAESETVSALTIGETPTNCRADRGTTPRGWKLVFQQK
jgi:hypothetical protein